VSWSVDDSSSSPLHNLWRIKHKKNHLGLTEKLPENKLYECAKNFFFWREKPPIFNIFSRWRAKKFAIKQVNLRSNK
jgi:hypothetical protein